MRLSCKNTRMSVTIKPRVRFVGYVEYEPKSYHAEFVVTGDPRLPADAQVNWDTLRGLRLPVPAFPDLYEWRRQNWWKVRNVLSSLGK